MMHMLAEESAQGDTRINLNPLDEVPKVLGSQPGSLSFRQQWEGLTLLPVVTRPSVGGVA